MRKKTIRIKKEEFPKPRRTWGRRPATQVTPSKKTYRRSKAKANARRQIKNAHEKGR